jgi:hypothetical protein
LAFSRRPEGAKVARSIALVRRDTEEQPALRILLLLALRRAAVWLGIAGIGAQAAAPLFLAFAVTSVEHVDGMNAAGRSAIHRHADHLPASPHHPAHHPGHQHKNCILCEGLQAASPATLPSALALALPRGEFAERATAIPTTFRVFSSSAAYVSRGPPSIG